MVVSMNKLLSAADETQSIEQALRDTVDLMGVIKEKLVGFGQNLLGAVIVLIIGWYIVKFMTRSVKKILSKSKLEASVSGFLNSAVNIGLKVILAIMVVTRLGIEMTSIATLIGSAGLAIGLAFQGSLSNLAGGVLILVLKPFLVGDYIIDGDHNEGRVTAIDIFYTKILTPDNRAVIIPNGTLANSTIINASKEDIRRIDFNVSIDYKENIEKVKGILYELGAKSEYTLKDKEIQVFVNKFDPSAIDMVLRLWTNAADYSGAMWTIRESIKTTFDKEGVVIPYNQLDVNIVQNNQMSK